MIKKIKDWIINNFLPAYARETLLDRNKKFEKKNEELLIQIEMLKSYIAGMEAASNNRIKIINKYSKSEREDKD